MNDDFRLEFVDGRLFMEGRDGWQEAVCAICDEPIRWCLDMFSFTTGHPHVLAHARCVWTTEAFHEQARLADLTYGHRSASC